ncbi:MAG: T9SS type A sorting domain-containing protein [Candidatus Marinimicrobia bacterium]|nr:T9SS type A sorting domain-containing protein [Candidatus Neomarinimicrobiota bacterium]
MGTVKISQTLVFSAVLFLALMGQSLIAGETDQGNPTSSGLRIQSIGEFDGNRIHSDLENNGMIVSHRISGHSGLEWPRGTAKHTVYASGLWIAGLVDGEIRTAVAEYAPELTPGPFGADGSEPEHVLFKITDYDLLEPASSPDFQNWPTTFGAPFVDVDEDGVYSPLPSGPDYPEMMGHQMLWYVSNDAEEANHTVFGTSPLGLEVQTTVWGYARNDELGDMMFVRSLIINKGVNQISDTYVGLWSDPDVGDAGDDFVGCDTSLGLGYAYNDGADGVFGENPPAVGYDFFQGPIIPAPGETAIAFGRTIPDYKNLNMTSFVKYSSGHPIYTDPNDAQDVYYYMQGFLRDGSPFINPVTGQPTKFVNPDDPNDNVDANDNVWVDEDDLPSDDRRFLMNAGPFDMAPGDSQEVIYGILHGLSVDALSSVTRLKEIDAMAQSIADNFYATPPDTTFADFANARNPFIVADNLNDDGVANNGELIKVSFSVENTGSTPQSFLVLVSPLSSGVNHVAGESFQIFDLPPAPISYMPPEGDEPLFYITPEFSSTTLDLQVDINLVGTSHWNQITLSLPVAILNYQPNPSIFWLGNIEGNTAGMIGFRIINPLELTNYSYQVTFSDEFFNSTGTLEPGLGINLTNTTTATLLLDRHILPDEHQFGFPITEGFKLLADEPPVGLEGVFQVANAAGDIPGGLVNDVNENIMWINFLSAPGYPTEQTQTGLFFVTHGGGEANDMQSFNDRVLRGSNWERAAGRVFEMRFTEDALTDGLAYRRFYDGVIMQVPFELWNMGADAENTDDDFRMLPALLHGGAGGSADSQDAFDFWGDDPSSSSDNDPSSDWIYWGNPIDETPGQSGYDTFFAPGAGGAANDGGDWVEVLARTRLMNWNGNVSHLDSVELSNLSSTNPAEWNAQDTTLFLSRGWFLDEGNALGLVFVSGNYAHGTVLHLPEVGSIHRWVANRPLHSGVSAQFNMDDVLTDLDEDLFPSVYSLAQNYPNPFNPITTIKYQLAAATNVQLVIYDLLGRELRVLSDGLESQGWHTQAWDGKDASGHLVSSGMYLYRLNAGTFSKTMKMVYLK